MGHCIAGDACAALARPQFSENPLASLLAVWCSAGGGK